MHQRTFVAVVALSVSLPALAAGPKTDTGIINGAEYRIDIPENWNGGLVMFCHGYSAGKSAPASLAPLLQTFTSQGYAVAQSAYASGGWAVIDAVQDTEALRRHFIQKHGKPKETWVTGLSMGGLITIALMENLSAGYDGGLALCPLSAPVPWAIERRAFDLHVVVDYFFPGLLPPPDKIPSTYQSNKESMTKILEGLRASPEKAEVVRKYAAIRSDTELARTLSLFTEILGELLARTGGSAFDNRNVVYDGTPDDIALNAGVKRYTADARAAEYVRHYSPTGRLTKPVLSIANIYDPLIPPQVTNFYALLVAQAGSSDRYVLQMAQGGGHCTLKPEEIARGFSQLREWKTSGKRPRSGVQVLDSDK